MDILLLLIPVSLLLLLLGGGLFWWTVNSGQYDDLDSPAQRILFDDDSDMVPNRPDRSRSGSGPAKPDEPVSADPQDSSPL
ncbi:cbb3-type cytochrome oxidase assembly protein CcoS [Saccharospirillum alexandrii]|uniref:cbb3-type cytochrome oxidase assembly protein CcoS n=1 Tax=Saccharospirillum alexandrii TaxID=2448477 RepID=UPI000FDAAC69|nr:cbb3-type cytochrome oxidase assembly protein CcoS [Saccharospirillum alexandrii]